MPTGRVLGRGLHWAPLRWALGGDTCLFADAILSLNNTETGAHRKAPSHQ